MCIRDSSYEIVVKEQNNDAVKYTIKTSAHVDSVDAIDWTDWTDTAGKNITIDINKYLDLPGTKTYEFHVTPVAYNSALYGVQKAQTSVEVTRNTVAKPTDFTHVSYTHLKEAGGLRKAQDPVRRVGND